MAMATNFYTFVFLHLLRFYFMWWYSASLAVFRPLCLIYKCVLQCCCGIFEIASFCHVFSLVICVLCAICIEFLLLLTKISLVLIFFLLKKNKHLIQTKHKPTTILPSQLLWLNCRTQCSYLILGMVAHVSSCNSTFAVVHTLPNARMFTVFPSHFLFCFFFSFSIFFSPSLSISISVSFSGKVGFLLQLVFRWEFGAYFHK